MKHVIVMYQHSKLAFFFITLAFLTMILTYDLLLVQVYDQLMNPIRTIYGETITDLCATFVEYDNNVIILGVLLASL